MTECSDGSKPNEAMHPALLDISALVGECQMSQVRASGPGGQHRNKVSTGIVLLHLPTGISGQATERRNQSQNREVALRRLRIKLAVQVRSEVPHQNALSAYADRYGGVRLRISESNEEYPGLLACLMDEIAFSHGALESAALLLKTSPSQIVRLLRSEPEAIRRVNQWRMESGRAALK